MCWSTPRCSSWAWTLSTTTSTSNPTMSSTWFRICSPWCATPSESALCLLSIISSSIENCYSLCIYLISCSPPTSSPCSNSLSSSRGLFGMTVGFQTGSGFVLRTLGTLVVIVLQLFYCMNPLFPIALAIVNLNPCGHLLLFSSVLWSPCRELIWGCTVWIKYYLGYL